MSLDPKKAISPPSAERIEPAVRQHRRAEEIGGMLVPILEEMLRLHRGQEVTLFPSAQRDGSVEFADQRGRAVARLAADGRELTVETKGGASTFDARELIRELRRLIAFASGLWSDRADDPDDLFTPPEPPGPAKPSDTEQFRNATKPFASPAAYEKPRPRDVPAPEVSLCEVRTASDPAPKASSPAGETTGDERVAGQAGGDAAALADAAALPVGGTGLVSEGDRPVEPRESAASISSPGAVADVIAAGGVLTTFNLPEQNQQRLDAAIDPRGGVRTQSVGEALYEQAVRALAACGSVIHPTFSAIIAFGTSAQSGLAAAEGVRSERAPSQPRGTPPTSDAPARRHAPSDGRADFSPDRRGHAAAPTSISHAVASGAADPSDAAFAAQQSAGKGAPPFLASLSFGNGTQMPTERGLEGRVHPPSGRDGHGERQGGSGREKDDRQQSSQDDFPEESPQA